MESPFALISMRSRITHGSSSCQQGTAQPHRENEPHSDNASQSSSNDFIEPLPRVERRSSVSRKIEITRSIGRGSFGNVYFGTYLGGQVAVKIFHSEEDSTISSEQNKLKAVIKREVTNLQKKRSEYILRFYRYIEVDNWLVTEYCANGSLYEFIRNASNRKIAENWNLRLNWMIQVALGMYSAHEEKPTVVHRDLKTSNIFLTEHLKAKVGDFGLSKMIEGASREDSTFFRENSRMEGQPMEVIRGKRACSQKSDVYSFGFVMHEVLTLESHFGITSSVVHGSIIAQGKATFGKTWRLLEDRSKYPGAWHDCLEGYISLMQECCDRDSARRPLFGEISNRLMRISEAYMKVEPTTTLINISHVNMYSLVVQASVNPSVPEGQLEPPRRGNSDSDMLPQDIGSGVAVTTEAVKLTALASLLLHIMNIVHIQKFGEVEAFPTQRFVLTPRHITFFCTGVFGLRKLTTCCTLNIFGRLCALPESVCCILGSIFRRVRRDNEGQKQIQAQPHDAYNMNNDMTLNVPSQEIWREICCSFLKEFEEEVPVGFAAIKHICKVHQHKTPDENVLKSLINRLDILDAFAKSETALKYQSHLRAPIV